MKKNFKFGTDGEFQAYWNEKEYGANKTVYLTITKLAGTQGQSQIKGSYSKAKEQFVDYRAGDLDLVKAAAQALDII